jgi:hypothetical protein
MVEQGKTQESFSDTGSLEGDLLAYFALSFPGLQGKSGTVLSGGVRQRNCEAASPLEIRSVAFVFADETRSPPFASLPETANERSDFSFQQYLQL